MLPVGCADHCRRPHDHQRQRAWCGEGQPLADLPLRHRLYKRRPRGYAHESGQTRLARVVSIEPKGLRLKRGGSPHEFTMPWDKIVGKMLFSYDSPTVQP